MTRKLPEPTTVDLNNWKRIVRIARQCAADPSASAGDLAKAEKAAKRSVVLGALNAENPCVRLVRLARQFCAATTRGRRELIPALLEAAEQIDCRLRAAKPPTGLAGEILDPPARRIRLDIDG